VRTLDSPRSMTTPMGRHKKPPTRTVRVEEDVAKMIHKCAVLNDADTPEWLSDFLRPQLQKLLLELSQKLQKESRRSVSDAS